MQAYANRPYGGDGVATAPLAAIDNHPRLC